MYRWYSHYHRSFLSTQNCISKMLRVRTILIVLKTYLNSWYHLFSLTLCKNRYLTSKVDIENMNWDTTQTSQIKSKYLLDTFLIDWTNKLIFRTKYKVKKLSYEILFSSINFFPEILYLTGSLFTTGFINFLTTQ